MTIKPLHKIVCLLAVTCCLVLQSKAQFEEGIAVNTVLGTPTLTGAALVTGATNTFTAYSLGSGELIPKITNIITLKIKENSTVYLATSFTATANITLQVTDLNNVVTNLPPFDLTVQYDKVAGAKYAVRDYKAYKNYKLVKVTLNNVNVPTNLGWDPKQVLEVQNEMRVTRYYNLSNVATDLTSSVITRVQPTPDVVNLSWNFPIAAHENMSQLEWAYIETEMLGFYGGNYNQIFQNNSTRVDLDYRSAGYNFKIPLLYTGPGKLYYRVRAVQRKANGTLISGDWSAVSETVNSLPVAAGHEENLNWQTSTSFAEEGKYKNVIQYFDGSLRGRQTVTKDNTTGNTIVGETIYDLQGRPNVQILPTPTSYTSIQFNHDFNRFVGMQPTDDPARFFDLTPQALKCDTARRLDITKGNGRYYSGNNDWLTGVNAEPKSRFIPDANGFAYTETRFTDDATQRVKQQGGVGIDHQISMGHETRYYYGKPAQQELDALFGTEVGDASHYSKNMVQDANNQMSVSYTDMHGRTIATSLAGDPTAGIDSIINTTDYPLLRGTSTIKNSLLTPASNLVLDNSIVSVSTLLAPATTNYQFTYKLNPEILQLLNCSAQPICFDCKYDLEISIKGEDCGNDVPVIRKYSNLQLVAANLACGTSMGFIGSGITTATYQINFSTTLSTGSYVIRKTLTLNDSMYNVRRDSALKVLLCRTQQQIYDSVYNVITTASGCGNTNPPKAACDSCLANLGTLAQYKTKYLLAISPATATDASIQLQYSTDSIECATACGTGLNPQFATLAGLRSQLLADMEPFTGQYATDTIKTVSGVPDLTSLDARYNIFTSSYINGGSTITTGKPYFKFPKTEAGLPTWYFDANNAVDSTIHGYNGTAAPIIDTITKVPFAGLFQESWAASLIYYHPEYNKLKYAETTLKAAYTWLDNVQNCTSYTAAVTAGYTLPVRKSTSTFNDPFFLLSTPDRDTIDIKLYSGIGYNYNNNPASPLVSPSIWQITNASVLCSTVDSTSKYACMMATTQAGLDPRITSTAGKDSVWEKFKISYLSLRNEMVLRNINNNTPGALSVADMAKLTAEGKQLNFATNQQVANQNGWTWWAGITDPKVTDKSGIAPYLANTAINPDNCASQKPLWKARLLQCEAFKALLNTTLPADTAKVNTIINKILDSLVMICNNSITPQQPYGASTVNPAFIGNPKRFEDVINNVLRDNSIATQPTNYFCNPFTIDFPKPFGINPPLFVNYSNSLDTCACNRYKTLKTEAFTAGYTDTASFNGINAFLKNVYKDSLTLTVWNGLKKCGSFFKDTCAVFTPTSCARCTLDVYKRTDFGHPAEYIAKCEIIFWPDSVFQNDAVDTFVAYINPTATLCPANCIVYLPILLPDYAVIPAFLNCGYVKPCITCTQLTNFTTEFRTLYPTYNGAPYMDSVTTTNAQIEQNALWARFLNFRTGFSRNALDYMAAAKTCQTAPGGNNAICALDKPVNDPSEIFVMQKDSCRHAQTQAQFVSQLVFTKIKDSITARFDSLYKAKCLNARFLEEFYELHQPKEYHYTLYYYDQAGNLVKTLPPAAVKPNYTTVYLDSINIARLSRIDKPNYKNNEDLATQYRYNSLNQVFVQQSPDGGVDSFYYDALGRLAVSQNAKQKLLNRYSYTLYDNLGRITEVGQKPQTNKISRDISRSPTSLATWFLGGSPKEQITRTVYDVNYYAGETPGTLEPQLFQRNLRNRVSYTQIVATEPAGGNYAGAHTAATYYSYDIHGNVDTLVQDLQAAMAAFPGNRNKKMVYSYDLISGKVNTVAYQPGMADQFYHRYSYDAEHRIDSVETSHDNLYWEKEADYEYYRHGPLARTVLGANSVQGIDYAYTIQGWLKGVNSTAVLPGTAAAGGGFDMGGDGATAATPARDAYGFSLNYFNSANGGDYKPVGTTVTPFAAVTDLLPSLTDAVQTGRNLYNGNIRAMLVNIPQLGNAGVYGYRYDQLNRIKAMNSFNGFANATNTLTAAAVDDYKERVSYDPNGNIRTYLRNGNAARLAMDNMSYSYKTTNNQLDRVSDAAIDASAGQYPNYNDIKQGQATGNYQYDAIGNLISDAAEGITNISWTVYGKIQSITKMVNSVTTTINYGYDASGNRISKAVTVGGTTTNTIYVRDASGNTMAVYTKDASINSGSLTQTELNMYGSSRLGVWNPNRNVATLAAIDYAAYNGNFIRGNKGFELSNHLGNVLVTINDKSVGVDVAPQNGIIDYDTAEIVTANDYYPFGMQMPGRKYSLPNSRYRYGFNRKENDNEVKGEGNQQDYGMRIYDIRLGKFLSVDPLSSQYPMLTPYQFASNRPIDGIDQDGEEYKPYHHARTYQQFNSSSVKDDQAAKTYSIKEFGLTIKVYAKVVYESTKDAFGRIHHFNTYYFVQDKAIVNDKNTAKNSGGSFKTEGTNWHYWMNDNESSTQMKQSEAVANGIGTGIFAGAFAIAAAPVISAAAPTIINAAEYGVQTYGRDFVINTAKQYFSNYGDASKIDFFDVGVSTLNPFKKLGIFGGAANETLSSLIDFKNGKISAVGLGKSTNDFIIDFGIGQIKSLGKTTFNTLSGNNQSRDFLWDILIGLGKFKIKEKVQEETQKQKSN